MDKAALNTVLFDLDGTLLPLDQDLFLKDYFRYLCQTMSPLGYPPEQLVKAVEAGTWAAFRNDGSVSNELCFWRNFTAACGKTKEEAEPDFLEFYKADFQRLIAAAQPTPLAGQCIRVLKGKGYTVALATNPIFPAVATESRMRWAGLNKSDFALVTTYENSSYCKPNPDYYREVLEKIGKQPEECLMVGNDVIEDMVARELGLTVKLLTGCVLHDEGADLAPFAPVDFPGLLAYLEALPTV